MPKDSKPEGAVRFPDSPGFSAKISPCPLGEKFCEFVSDYPASERVDHDLTQKYGSPGAQTLRVATTYIHHNHNSQTLDNDIALLKLHGEADLKEGVCLVCLPARGTNQVNCFVIYFPVKHIFL